MKIRLCRHNQGTADLLHQLQATDGLHDLKIKKCLKQCRQCKKQTILLLDNQLISEDTPQRMRDRVVMLINEKE